LAAAIDSSLACGRGRATSGDGPAIAGRTNDYEIIDILRHINVTPHQVVINYNIEIDSNEILFIVSHIGSVLEKRIEQY
jgi:hypothetical protein